MTTREEVYAALDGERDYQGRRWGGQAHDSAHSVTEFLFFMRDYIEAALNLSSGVNAEANERALHNVRKVAALGVACMEVHGAPRRS